MQAFFKRVGKFFIYLFTLPVYLVAAAGVAVLGLLVFVILFFKSIVLFFTGRSFKNDLPEDIKLAELLKQSNQLPISSSSLLKEQINEQVEQQRQQEHEQERLRKKNHIIDVYTPETSNDVEIDEDKVEELYNDSSK